MSTVPKPLLDDIADGRCLPFIGAGFSMNARLPEGETMPDWKGLNRILATEGNVTDDGSGPGVASAFEKEFGRVELIETIRNALKTDSIEPGMAHRAFITLPFDTIYTTNFDLLLEETCERARRPYRSLVGELQMPFFGGAHTMNIVKMHGDLRHEEHMIVTEDDYATFLDKYPVISTHLSAMLITKTALFIGYSLSDLDFRHIREIVLSRLGRFQRTSYIIQFNVSESDIEKMSKDDVHVINLEVPRESSIDEILAGFFYEIREELDAKGEG